MDEEAMWKGLYETLQEKKTKPPTEHDMQYVNNCFIIIMFLKFNFLPTKIYRYN